MLGFFLNPLVAADRGDAEDVKFIRLKENKDSLLIAGAGPAGVLVNDDFDSRGQAAYNSDQRNKILGKLHNRSLPKIEPNSHALETKLDCELNHARIVNGLIHLAKS
jgi:hypothetical protein